MGGCGQDSSGSWKRPMTESWYIQLMDIIQTHFQDLTNFYVSHK
jgi:hypothetical protein